MDIKHARYRNQTIADFVRQLLYTPKSKRPEQIARAEVLHDLINPDQNYPFDFINYRITGYHSESEFDEATILVGEALLPDLRTAIEELCLNTDTLPGKEPMTDLATLAKQLNVSTKTIHRWRDMGLRSRWYKPPGHKRMILGFTPSAIDTFDKRHPGKIKQATERQQMSTDDVDQLIADARQLTADDPTLSLNQVASKLSKQTGRPLQTIRVQLQKYDQAHPDHPLFPDHHGPLTDRQARQIARLQQRGMSTSELAKMFGKTPSTIRRAILNARLQVFKRLNIDPAKFQECYTDPAKVKRYRQFKIRDTDWQSPDTHASSDLPVVLHEWFSMIQLKPAVKLQAFEQYQYLRYAAKYAIDQLQPNTCTTTQIKAITADIKQAGQLKDLLAASSLPVVMSVARHHMDHLDEQSVYILQDLLILGCQILFGELDLFDPHRKHAFDTFLSWRLQRSFATWLSDQHRAKRAVKRMTPEEVIRRIRSQAIPFGIKLPAMIEV